ncbi:hypothetical protein DRZ78_04490 [Candidatus Aerophobetes bacterium]|uniref:ABC transporter permease n=1 Tax=Aerophobetes bacterium TaxID=2030807 RepID=A0A662D0I2_UNCAE|nr:MAG: hypothetical protein DRZ78_04490 [Candidatus Aerophobetes bacterium]
MLSFKTNIMEDFVHTYISITFELRKHLRRKRLIIATLLTVAIPILFYAIPKIWNIAFIDIPALFLSSSLGFVSILIIISAALFGGDTVSGEFERKTALLTFSTPQKRTSIFIGKYCAALIAISVLVSLYYLITVVEVIAIYGIDTIPYDIVTSYLLALLYGSSVLSLTFFFSSILKGTISSTLIGFFTLMMILPILSTLLMVASVEPWFIVTYSAGLITSVFGLPIQMGGPPFGAQGGGHPGEQILTMYQPDFTIGVIVMTVYTLLFLIIGIIVADRKDVE